MKNHILISLLIWAVLSDFHNALGQNIAKIDSLKMKLHGGSSEEQINTLLSICLEYAEDDPLTALTYADKAFQYALKIGDSLKIVHSGRIKAQILLKADRVHETIVLLTRILPTAEKIEYADITKLLNCFAVAETYKGNYEGALRYHFRSLIKREQEGDKKAISIAYANIALVFFKLENYREALKYNLKSFALKKQVRDSFDLSRLLINIGLCYNQLNDYEKAFSNIKEGFKLCENNCDEITKIEGTFALGISFKGLQKFDSAIIFLNRSLNLSTERDNKRFQLESLKSLARIFILLKRYDEAKIYLRNAEFIANKLAYQHILCDIYLAWSNLYANLNDFEKAYIYYDKYGLLYGTIMTNKIMDVSQVQLEFNERESRKIINAQTQILELKEQVIQNHRLVIALIGCLAFLLVALIMRLLYRYIQKKRDNKVLDLLVQERTVLLRNHLQILKKSHDEQSLFFAKTASDLKKRLKTLHGLINLLAHDPGNEETLNRGVGYILEIERKLTSVSEHLTNR